MYLDYSFLFYLYKMASMILANKNMENALCVLLVTGLWSHHGSVGIPMLILITWLTLEEV